MSTRDANSTATMAGSGHWSAPQLAVLQALEMPLYERRPAARGDASSATSAVAPETVWCLRASAAQAARIRQQRWYVQLCRYRAPGNEQAIDHAAAEIVVRGLALALENDPPTPSPQTKRAIYQALRSGGTG
jgi:hypothetical protein